VTAGAGDEFGERVSSGGWCAGGAEELVSDVFEERFDGGAAVGAEFAVYDKAAVAPVVAEVIRSPHDRFGAAGLGVGRGPFVGWFGFVGGRSFVFEEFVADHAAQLRHGEPLRK